MSKMNKTVLPDNLKDQDVPVKTQKRAYDTVEAAEGYGSNTQQSTPLKRRQTSHLPSLKPQPGLILSYLAAHPSAAFVAPTFSPLMDPSSNHIDTGRYLVGICAAD